VVERYPLYEHSGYTKQVTWVDTEEFRVMKIDFYDRKEEKLKTLTYEDYQQYLDRYWRANKFFMVNHQSGKSTDILWNNYRFQVGLKESDFTQANLKRIK
ncbi:MAG: outer membrane lipoprotein-sorting protein, partial [Rickettsiales bacterium]|nr:outer membrane lipoprotein-sorting protein [Rickettsiales bacterium]